LAIVIVNKSLDAANAIIAGNSVKLIASLNIASPMVRSAGYAAKVEGALAVRPATGFQK
jgi:hypothetical protein